MKKPLIRKITKPKQYKWLLNYMPKKLMYETILIEGAYLTIPKYGWLTYPGLDKL